MYPHYLFHSKSQAQPLHIFKTTRSEFYRGPCLLRCLSVKTSALHPLHLETLSRQSCFRWKKRDEVSTHVKYSISYWLSLVALHIAFWAFGPFTLKILCCVRRLYRQITRIVFWNQTSTSWVFQPLNQIFLRRYFWIFPTIPVQLLAHRPSNLQNQMQNKFSYYVISCFFQPNLSDPGSQVHLKI